MPRRKVDRLRQILVWLEERWPPPFPVQLDYSVPDDDLGFGEAYELEGDRKRIIYLQVSPKLPWVFATDTLLHEFAHALTWPVSPRQVTECPPHSVAWAAAYGELYREFYDEGGYLDSRDYDY